MSERENEEFDALEAALKSLQPASPDIDRATMLYRAGQAAQRRRSWKISALTSLMGMLLGIIGTYFAVQSSMSPVERVVVVEVERTPPAPPPPSAKKKQQPKKKETTPTESGPYVTNSSPPAWGFLYWSSFSSSGYLGLREQVLRWGVDAMASPLPAPSSTQSPEILSVYQMYDSGKQRPNGS